MPLLWAGRLLYKATGHLLLDTFGCEFVVGIPGGGKLSEEIQTL